MIDPQTVFIDVQPWILAIEAQRPNEKVPMSGIMRHAALMCRYFQPAMLVLPGEPLRVESRLLLEKFLSKRIVVLETKTHETDVIQRLIFEHGCKFWVNLAPDCTGPAIADRNRARQFKVVTIVHDTMALERTFGEINRVNYLRSMNASDAFAFVSLKAKIDFNQAMYKAMGCELGDFPKSADIPYACSHGLEEIPNLFEESKIAFCTSRGWKSLSVSSHYPHKNLRGAITVARYFQTNHVHIGRFVRPQENDILYGVKNSVSFTGGLSDEAVFRFMRDADVFVCMSYNEGFSMPAMEAILHGVKRIVLSDIPVHREIYAGLHGVVFVNPDDPQASLISQDYAKVPDLPLVDESSRMELFGTFHPENIIATFKDAVERVV